MNTATYSFCSTGKEKKLVRFVDVPLFVLNTTENVTATILNLDFLLQNQQEFIRLQE